MVEPQSPNRLLSQMLLCEYKRQDGLCPLLPNLVANLKEGSETLPPRLARQAVEAVVLFKSICARSITFTMFSVLPLLEKRQKAKNYLNPNETWLTLLSCILRQKYIF